MPTVSVYKLDKENKSTGEELFSGEIELGQPIFDQLDSQDFKLPFGCLAGSCGSCVILVLEGADLIKAPGTIESDTVSHLVSTSKIIPPSEENTWQYRLSCRAKMEKEGKLVLGVIHREK